MAHRVGPKGQVVISKETRERLGIEPGWETLERVVGDEVILRFIPPEHNRSLHGKLRSFASSKRRAKPDEKEQAWNSAAAAREKPWKR